MNNQSKLCNVKDCEYNKEYSCSYYGSCHFELKPIVYCKDCKFSDDIQGCVRLNIFVNKNTFYCEYAMRKESEEE